MMAMSNKDKGSHKEKTEKKVKGQGSNRSSSVLEKAEKLMEKGNRLFSQGKLEEAMEIFDRIIEIQPNNKVAWNNKGVVFDQLGKHNEAC